MSISLRDYTDETYEHFEELEPLTPFKNSSKCRACTNLLRWPLQLGCGHR